MAASLGVAEARTAKPERRDKSQIRRTAATDVLILAGGFRSWDAGGKT